MSDLFNKCSKEQEKYLIEQYKIYIELADRISQRRAVANTFYLTLNIALLSFIAGFKEKIGIYYLLLILASGIVVSIFWFFSIKSYRQLNTAKFNLIHEIETRLPLNLFKYEWEQLKFGKSFNTYWPLTYIEKFVPFVFILLYILFGMSYKIYGS